MQQEKVIQARVVRGPSGRVFIAVDGPCGQNSRSNRVVGRSSISRVPIPSPWSRNAPPHLQLRVISCIDSTAIPSEKCFCTSLSGFPLLGYHYG
jgi:hypothetical protein